MNRRNFFTNAMLVIIGWFGGVAAERPRPRAIDSKVRLMSWQVRLDDRKVTATMPLAEWYRFQDSLRSQT